MRLFLATVTANELIQPASHLLTLDVGAAAQGASPGQLVAIRCGDGTDPLLRFAAPIYRAEQGSLQVLVAGAERAAVLLRRSKRGEVLDCLGPIGRELRLDGKVRNLLLIGEGPGVAPLVGLAEVAIRRGVNVALAVAAPTESEVFPAGLLPDEVEYLVATADGSSGYRGELTDLVPDRLPWADALVCAAPPVTLEKLAEFARQCAPRTPALAWLSSSIACGVGACLGCVIETRKGPRRVCTDGPAFGLDEIAWESQPSGNRR